MTSSSISISEQGNRRKIARAFKMRGLSIQASALDALLNVLRREEEASNSSVSSVHDTLYNIIDEIKEYMMSMPSRNSASSSLQQLVVTKRILSDVVSEMSRNEKDVQDESLQLLDAFDMPRLVYDSMKKNFTLMSAQMEAAKGGGRSVFGEANHKVEMSLQRYLMVHQRILRQCFQPKLLTGHGRNVNNDGQGGAGGYKITPIESLLGRSGIRFLLGMIVQVEEGHYYLEDNTAQVPIDLSQTSVLTDGFITENCIVLVEGEMVDGTLFIHRMGNPLYESRLDTMNTIGLQNSDLFNSMPSLSELSKMREQELEHGEDGMFVILSDVHLDKPHILSKLETLFEGFQAMDPLPVFVLMGNFTSKPLSASRDGPRQMMGYYEDLANAIAKFPRVAQQGKFVFVPGPNDPGLGKIMPRPPIPSYFTAALRSKVPHAIFASNPCRIRYFSKELVFCRQDIVNKLRRNCIIEPLEEENEEGEGEGVMSSITDDTKDANDGRNNPSRIVQHAVKTMVDQSHLCPLPLTVCPVYWQYDHVLRLYPLPDALIVGDKIDQYFVNYAECDAINPGPFSADFSFVVYRPVREVTGAEEFRSDVEFSQIQ